VHEEPTEGRQLNCLPVLDAYTREGLTIPGARSITAEAVGQVRQRLVVYRGAPVYGKSDNGPEFMAQRGTTGLREQRVDTHFIDLGRPWQNGQNESCNDVFGDGCLNRWLLISVQEARRIITHWLARTTTWSAEWADTPCMCSAMPLPTCGEGSMSISNIDTGRVTLGLTKIRAGSCLGDAALAVIRESQHHLDKPHWRIGKVAKRRSRKSGVGV
jgi:hypothetical protein